MARWHSFGLDQANYWRSTVGSYNCKRSIIGSYIKWVEGLLGICTQPWACPFILFLFISRHSIFGTFYYLLWLYLSWNIWPLINFQWPKFVRVVSFVYINPCNLFGAQLTSIKFLWSFSEVLPLRKETNQHLKSMRTHSKVLAHKSQGSHHHPLVFVHLPHGSRTFLGLNQPNYAYQPPSFLSSIKPSLAQSHYTQGIS